MFREYSPSSGPVPARGSMSEVAEDARLVEAFVASDLFRWSDCEGFREGAFGTKAGPSYTVFNLLHEMSHCVQLSDAEVIRAKPDPSGWGLTVRQQYIPGYGSFTDVQTTQCSEREAEVAGIQLVLSEHLFGVDQEEFLQYVYELFTWFPDYLYIPTSGPDAQDEHVWIREKILEAKDKWADPERIRARLLQNLGVLLS